MRKADYDPPDTHNSADEVDSVVLTIRDVMTCAGAEGRRTFTNPCAAETYETFDNDDASIGAFVQNHDSFYSTVTSEISGLKPFQLPSLSPNFAHQSAQPSSDTLFAGLESPSHASAARSDGQMDTMENLGSRSMAHDAVNSPMTVTSETSAIKSGLGRGLMSLISCESDLEAGNMDKYYSIEDAKQERAITTELSTCDSADEGALRPKFNSTAVAELRKGDATISESLGRRKSILDVTTEVVNGAPATEPAGRRKSSGPSKGVPATTENAGGSRSNLNITKVIHDVVASRTCEGERPKADNLGSPQAKGIEQSRSFWLSKLGKKVETALSRDAGPGKSRKKEVTSNELHSAVYGEGGRDVGQNRSNLVLAAVNSDSLSANENPKGRCSFNAGITTGIGKNITANVTGRKESIHGNEKSSNPAIVSLRGKSHLQSALFQHSESKTSTEEELASKHKKDRDFMFTSVGNGILDCNVAASTVESSSDVLHLELSESSISHCHTSDEESMVAVEVVHIGSMPSQDFGELPINTSIDEDDAATIESRSFLVGKQMSHTKVAKVTETAETRSRCGSVYKKKKCWIGAILLAALLLVVAISSGIAANNASASASVNARSAVVGVTSSVPSASSSPSQIPSLAPSQSVTPSHMPSTKPSLDPSITPSKTPSLSPSFVASDIPSHHPSERPSIGLSSSPTLTPSYTLSAIPSLAKSNSPSSTPTKLPSAIPWQIASAVPSQEISENPSSVPSIVLLRTKSPQRSSSPTLLSSSPSSDIDAFAGTMNLYAPTSPDDPLYQALEWAMAQTHPPSRQRIALATLYFGTGGENWLDQISFLSDDDECLWAIPYGATIKGVRCTDEGEVSVISLGKYRTLHESNAALHPFSS
jgi:hypothetical protein